MQLYHASAIGDIGAIRRAIADGATVHFMDGLNNTALHLAAGGGHVLAVKALLEAGALRTVANKMGHTPADRAAINQHPRAWRCVCVCVFARANKMYALRRGSKSAAQRWILHSAQTI